MSFSLSRLRSTLRSMSIAGSKLGVRMPELHLDGAGAQRRVAEPAAVTLDVQRDPVRIGRDDPDGLQIHSGCGDHGTDDVRDPALVDRPAGCRLPGLANTGLANTGLTGPGLADPGLAGSRRVTLASCHHDLLVHDLRDWLLAYPGFGPGADRTGRPA